MDASHALQGRLHDFPGGLHLDYHKDLATGTPIRQAPVPPRLVLPLQQHIGAPAEPVVEVGQRVLRGQVIARAQGYVSLPVHASSSGTVVAIGEQPVAHPSGIPARAIVIETDGLDEAAAPSWTPLPDYRQAEPHMLRDIVREAGIAGLGGATFPSFIKLNPGRPVDALVINGAECEPYISCDQMLMTENAQEIVAGIGVMLHALQAPRCIIGVEDNKPAAIAALEKAAEVDGRIRVVTVPTRYPQGGEKQLIQTLTGREVPSQGLPLDIGIICHNPGTTRAVYRAVVHGEPLIDRVVSVTGRAVREPQNMRARIGTPLSFLLDLAGGLKVPAARLVMGGPMMGITLRDADVPMVKATNCILAMPAEDVRPPEAAMPCIRCGACADVCPAKLLPQQLYWHARAKEFDKTEKYNLFDCIECGCCAVVCPSHIPLVQYYRYAKTEIWADERERRAADAARVRFEARQQRLEREEREKEEARQRRKAAASAAKQAQTQAPEPAAPAATAETAAADDPVARAIAAAKAKKAAAPTAEAGEDPVAKAVAAAKARKAAAKTETETSAESDPVALAIAAAKAKKAAKAAAEASDTAKPDATAEADDPVARAIAAAKAKKAAKAAAEASDTAKPDATAEADDPVARAIAAAKAKKAAKAAAEASDTAKPDATAEAGDPVARAIAAAKARKAAKAAADGEGSGT